MDDEFLLALYRLAREARPDAFHESLADLVWMACRETRAGGDGQHPADRIDRTRTRSPDDRPRRSKSRLPASDRRRPLEAAWFAAAMPHLVEAWHIHRVIHPQHDAGFLPVIELLAVVERRSGAILHAQDELLACIGDAWNDFDGTRMPLALRRLWQHVDRFECRSGRVEVSGIRAKGLVLITAHPSNPMPWVTPRQQQIAALYSQGWSHKDIATRTRLSPATVRNHIANVFARLKVHSRGELIEAVRTIRGSSR